MSAVRAVLLVVALSLVVPSAARAADIFGVGSQTRLTRVGADGTATVDATNPAVVHNTRDNEYLLVWTGNLAPGGDVEVRGQILDANGVPQGAVQTLSTVADGDPSEPVVGYSPAVNQYMLAYVASPDVVGGNPANSPAGQREVIAQVVTATGARSGNPARISNTDPANADADQAGDPALGYDPGADQFRFFWRSDSATESDFEISTQRVSSSLVNPDNFAELSVSNTAAGDAGEPAVAFMPGVNRWAVAYVGATGASSNEIFAAFVSVGGGVPVPGAPISAGGGTAARPSVAVSTARSEAMVAFTRSNVTGEGPEVFVQRLSSAGAQLPNATDQRISTMGPANNLAYGVSTARNTTATYHPLLDRYLVTWAADHDLPGLVDNEFERYGQALDGAGAEVAADDFRLTVSGADGSTVSSPEGGATIAVPTKRAWLHVWSADDNRPPLADGEFEVYGRFAGDDGDLDGHVAPQDCDDANPAIHPGAVDVLDNGTDEDCNGVAAENLDRDGDGSPRPADCNDASAGVRPGAADTPDNGVDEDCSGADAVNLDRDGDGAARPGDCDDANPAVRPGAEDTPRNGRDEDCAGGDASFPTLTTTLSPFWDIDGTRFEMVSLRVAQQFPKGLKLKLVCKGSRCPVKSKALKLGKVRKGAASAISSLSKRQRVFRAGQTLELWASAPSFNSRISRLKLKRGKIPLSAVFCALPGSSKVQRSCT